jgi:hypothetical protein
MPGRHDAPLSASTDHAARQYKSARRDNFTHVIMAEIA